MAGLYSNLITSAATLTPARTEALREAGLDSVQISFQAEDPELADAIAGTPAHTRKLHAAALVTSLGWPLTNNVVIHRLNIDHIPAIIAFAHGLGAHRLELAHTHYYGWGLRNRAALLPSADQAGRADAAVIEARARLGASMEVLHVIPDYHADYPKPCMNGWGSTHLAVVPIGRVLPCPAAAAIRSLRFDSVRDHSLAWIWRESPAFNAYRGEAWMQEPWRACPPRRFDLGGCRCQAYLLTGDAANADPVCQLSPRDDIISDWRVRANQADADASPLPAVHRAMTPPGVLPR